MLLASSERLQLRHAYASGIARALAIFQTHLDAAEKPPAPTDIRADMERLVMYEHDQMMKGKGASASDALLPCPFCEGQRPRR